MRKTTILATMMMIIWIHTAWAETVKPVVIIYTGGNTAFAEMLAALIEEDERIDSEIEIVSSAEVLIMASVLPTTECIVIHSAQETEVKGLAPSLTNFIRDGGGLVGMTEVCYEPSGQGLATTVFPIFGNASAHQKTPAVGRVRVCVKDQSTEINADLPETFPLVSMGTYYSADTEGNYVEVPGDYEVAYRDQEVGCPLVLTYETEGEGRSVSLPGIWVVSHPRVDVYFGNLVADENFVKLFTNSVYWAAKGSGRFPKVSQDLAQKIEDAKKSQDKIKEEAEKAKRRESTQRNIILAVVWGIGLVACGIIVWKIVLAPIDIQTR